MSPAPDAAQRQAAASLELRKRMREVEDGILARAPEHDLEPSLDRIRAVMDLLGEPQRTFPVIHVTGTNGKTSTARIIESILREAGLKTGRFTSPHLQDIRERITIGGELITRQAFLDAWADIAPFVDAVDTRSVSEGGPRMTYFEVLVALAYTAFADAPVDVAIVEVGMGGSWDATNVVEADVAVITPIGVDHQHFLGDSVLDIAREKSGIIHPGAIAVSAPQGPEVAEAALRAWWAQRDEGADDARDAVGDAVRERDADVVDGLAEADRRDAPEEPAEGRHENRLGRCRGDVLEEPGNRDRRPDARRDDHADNREDRPHGLPGERLVLLHPESVRALEETSKNEYCNASC